MEQRRKKALVIFLSGDPRQQKIKLGVLGPSGTFSEEAAINYVKRNLLKADFIFYATIEECLDGVEKGEADFVIAPILNSSVNASWVNETLFKLRNNNLSIYDEEILPIKLHLAALPGTSISEIKFVYSKDKAIQQCKSYISRTFRNVELICEGSTASAAEKVKSSKSKLSAAIVPARVAEIAGLEILDSDIQDEKNNKTRFIIAAKTDHEPTGNDKTDFIFEFKDVQRPSLLYELLGEFASREISLAYLQSLPKEGSLEEFTFYAEIFGHRTDKRIREAFHLISKKNFLSYWKVLGSYPRHEF